MSLQPVRKTHAIPEDRILVVEDDDMNLQLFTDYLQHAGFQIEQAANGDVALKKLKADPNYALVLSDRIMPVMNGIELAQHMKQDRRLQNIPIIIQTGANSPDDITQGLKADIYYYLTKPFQEEALISLVRSAIRDSKQRDVFMERIDKQRHALGTFCNGKFEIKTPQEAEDVSFLLGSLFPQPDTAVIGLYELTMNAIEHGNLNIGHAEKSRLLTDGKWETEIEHRLSLPENANKKVTIVFSQTPEKIETTITDQGQGFDWKSYMDMEPSRATQSNGRGIAKANLLCFDNVVYQNKGTTVHITKHLKPATDSADVLIFQGPTNTAY